MVTVFLGFPREVQTVLNGTHYSLAPCESIAAGFALWARQRLSEGTKPNLIVIYVHALLRKHSFCTEHEGVEVLKHLRLSSELEGWRKCHVVLTSWDSADDIIRQNAGNSIIFSSGVTFVHVLESIELLSDRKRLEALANNEADLADPYLIAAVRADYRPPASDHQISNWWGAWRLIRAIEGESAKMPLHIEQKMSLLASKQAVFLNPGPDPNKQQRISRKSLKWLQEIVTESTPTICYVDDEADQGWEHAFRTLLYGLRDSSRFRVINLSHEGARKTIPELAKDIFAESPNLLILDLRLAGNREASTPPKETTGALLLKEVRKHDQGLPILLMTASNKARTLQDLLQIGADAYWMKEGIGEHAPSHVFENPAIELTRLLETLLRENWQFLFRFERAVRELRAAFKTGNCWWSHKRNWKPVMWGNTAAFAPSETMLNEADAEHLFSIMLEMARLYREFLSLELFAYSGEKRTDASKDLWLRGITLHAARVIEAVHRFNEIEIQAKKHNETQTPRLPLNISGLIRDRGDELGQVLYNQRNAAAHYRPNSRFTDADTRQLIGLLCAWLRLDPSSYRLGWRERYDPDDSLQDALDRYPQFNLSSIARLRTMMFTEDPWKDEPCCAEFMASDKLAEFRTKEGERIGAEALLSIVRLENGPRAALALQCLQPFAKYGTVQRALQQRWNDGRTTSQLRCHLIWRIGDDSNLVDEFKTEMRSWIFDHFGEWTLGVQDFFSADPETILDAIQKKLDTGGKYPEYKKWIVICCVPISSHEEDAYRLLLSLSSTDQFVQDTTIAVLERFFPGVMKVSSAVKS